MVNVGVVISYSVDSDKDFDDEVDVNYTNLYGWQSFQPINENNYKFLFLSQNWWCNKAAQNWGK